MVKLRNQEYIDEKFEEGYESLNKYLDVPGMIELRELLVSLRPSEYLNYLGNIKYYIFDDILKVRRDIPLFKDAEKGLSRGLSSFKSYKISWPYFTAVYSIILYSSICNYKHDLSFEERLKIIHSDLPIKLSLGLDKCMTVDDSCFLDLAFFKKLNKIKWSKKAKNIQQTIKWGYWNALSREHDLHSKVFNQFVISNEYLSCCYAFSEGRDEVIGEDVIRAWLLILRVFLADWREYIFNTGK